MKLLAFATVVIASLFAIPAEAEVCDNGLNCIFNCCCYSFTGYYCCACTSVSVAWWGWLLIVLGIIFFLALAIGVGVWRRRVYLSSVHGTTRVVTSGGGGVVTY
ncbi:uncharacterized protein [Oscarella lobularis]|uniref:uncharacterized protein n=1 Tax=Oscarella lobularis TaxID=121494 RepID=UPI0033141A36